MRSGRSRAACGREACGGRGQRIIYRDTIQIILLLFGKAGGINLRNAGKLYTHANGEHLKHQRRKSGLYARLFEYISAAVL